MYENMMNLPPVNNRNHGLIRRIANSVSFDDFKNVAEKDKDMMRKKFARNAKPVKARYINYRGPNEICEKPYMNYAGDPIDTWRFIHDQVYEVPQGLIDEINDPSKCLPRRSEVLDKNGVPTIADGPRERIHHFMPADFS